MKHWSLHSKIVGTIAIFVVSNLVVLGLGIQKLAAEDHLTQHIVDVLVERMSLAYRLENTQTFIALQAREGLLEADAASTQTHVKKMAEARAAQEATLEALLTVASEEGKTLAAEYKRQFAAWYFSLEEALAQADEGRRAEGWNHVKTKSGPLREAMAHSLEQNLKLNHERMEAAEVEAEDQFKAAVVEMLVVSGVALLIGAVLATVILRRVNRRIDGVIGALQDNSDQVAAASAQIASSSEELSQAATEQAASLEETAASLEQISAMIAKSSENAGTTATRSAESQAKAEEGRHAVEQMLQAMTEIHRSNDAIVAQIDESNQRMGEIVRVIQEIGNKTKVINEIVFQTKLLSFNASVEAARAGDHGKGFAVVAEEVGNLAQMSGNAASEISEMLSGSVGKVEQIVNDTKSKVSHLTANGRQKIEVGVEVARQCAVILKDIVHNVTAVSSLAREISQASSEQAQGVGEINKAMGQLDAVTQQNAATSEEAASAAEQLSAQAGALKSSVIELGVTVHGGVGASGVAAALPAAAPRAERPAAAVLPIRTAPKAASGPRRAPPLKVAVGDGRVPSRDDDGFSDV